MAVDGSVFFSAIAWGEGFDRTVERRWIRDRGLMAVDVDGDGGFSLSISKKTSISRSRHC